MDEKEKLLKESRWYLGWTVMFLMAAIIVWAVAMTELFKGKDTQVGLLSAVGIAVSLFDNHLLNKSKQYRQRADEV